MPSFEILSYAIRQSSGSALSGLIHLYGESHRHIGNLSFALIGDPTPSPSQRSDGFISLFFPHSAFAFVVDILRNEKPCYLMWGGTSGSVGSSIEGVGEHETSPLTSLGHGPDPNQHGPYAQGWMLPAGVWGG